MFKPQPCMNFSFLPCILHVSCTLSLIGSRYINKFWLCNLLHHPIASSPLRTNIFLRTIPQTTLSLDVQFFLNVNNKFHTYTKDQVKLQLRIFHIFTLLYFRVKDMLSELNDSKNLGWVCVLTESFFWYTISIWSWLTAWNS